VFDGARDRGAYAEDDPPAPLGAYGMSKLAGETEVRAALERHVIVRTAWLYGRGGRNFVDTMLGLFRGRPCVEVVRDQVGTPTWTRDLAQAILAILKSVPGNQRATAAWGTYHFANDGAVSRFDFARAIYEEARAAGRAPKGVLLRPVAASDFPARAARPHNSALALDKIRAAFPVAIRGWRDALRDYIREGAAAA
jgi:dTDP-4-dehydrorhamnose reductase